MGYWNTSPEGHSFVAEEDLTWGDSPADVMTEAIEEITKIFEKDMGRKPALEEIIAGVHFSGRDLPHRQKVG